ncbi:MAG: selenium-dependent molybdenum cofactor biosynthesis protein YqeB [Eubacteriales bacterium]|nr:selenium-dependent molybdenum cofactor biosynthesis protein YqeB [Eubacteriales bacterium]
MSRLVVVRGAGDLASGTIAHLHRCGFAVLALECRQPAAIRRLAAFCEAVYDGTHVVEGITCRRIEQASEAWNVIQRREIPLLVDQTAACLKKLQPAAVVDAIIAKKNMGTHTGMAPIVVALGPGFSAPQDCHAVVETMRGHNLGRVIYEGSALPNTGVPGVIQGYGIERVIHAPAAGVMHCVHQIGDAVEKGEVIGYVGETPVYASLTGVLRGILRESFAVPKGMKLADIDPRVEQKQNCRTISDKARCIAGGVMEALMVLGQQKGVYYI